jgi:predicted ATPase
LLGAIWDGPGALSPHLEELKRQEFVYEQTGAEEPAYVFKHALTQDVAYESLLTRRREALHAAAGQALEKLYADRLEGVYDRLAHHYSKTDQAAKAIEYLARFADKAARVYANADAARALEEALAHVERLPVEERDRRVLEIVPRLAHSQYFLGRVPDTLALLLAQQERVERMQAPALASPYYFWLGHRATATAT